MTVNVTLNTIQWEATGKDFALEITGKEDLCSETDWGLGNSNERSSGVDVQKERSLNGNDEKERVRWGRTFT